MIDFADNEVRVMNPMSQKRTEHAMVKHGDKVFVIGGCLLKNNVLDSCEAFDIPTE